MRKPASIICSGPDLVVWIPCCYIVGTLCPLSTAKVMPGLSVILATLFLDRPPRDMLPVLSAHFFYH